MKLDEAIKIEKEAFERRLKIRISKAKDYANEDCLANFKVTADVCKALKKHNMEIDITTPQGVALFHQFLKTFRRLNLYKKNTDPENESLIDTFDDNSNYLDLEKEGYIDYMREKKK